jgi:hypothetical protein
MNIFLTPTFGQRRFCRRHVSLSLEGAKVATMITTKDFQDYWQCVDERTSSFFSSITFLHYKAASFHTMLLVMQAACLTACT